MRHAVGRGRQLLDVDREADLARQRVGEVVAQVRPVEVRAAPRRRPWCPGRRRGARQPSLPTSTRKAACSGAERPAAEVVDARRRQRAAERADRDAAQPPAVDRRVVHQVLPTCPLRPSEPGGQHQLGVLDRVRGQHVGAGRHGVDGVPRRGRVLVALVLDALHRAADGVDVDLRRHGLREHAPAGSGRPAASDLPALYLAWIGQIGVHAVLPAQRWPRSRPSAWPSPRSSTAPTGRSRRAGCELRAAG